MLLAIELLGETALPCHLYLDPMISKTTRELWNRGVSRGCVAVLETKQPTALETKEPPALGLMRMIAYRIASGEDEVNLKDERMSLLAGRLTYDIRRFTPEQVFRELSHSVLFGSDIREAYSAQGSEELDCVFKEIKEAFKPKLVENNMVEVVFPDF